MFTIFCCCCLKTNGILFSIETKSSHEDDKTLLDYLNFMFENTFKEQQAPAFICKRCSKALQVSYHFINMVNKAEECGKKSYQIVNKLMSFDISSSKEEHQKIEDIQQNSPFNEFLNENQLKLDLNYDSSFINGPPKILLPVTKKDAERLLHTKEYILDFFCNVCNKTFDDKPSFEEHVKQKHKEIMPYKCKLCNFYTCYTESLFKHCEKNHGLTKVALDHYQNKDVSKIADGYPVFDVIYACVSCNFKDRNPAIIDEHLLNDHSMDQNRESFVMEMFSCPACYRSFLTLKSAKIHYSMHHICSFKKSKIRKAKKFYCENCGKLFDLKTALFHHRRMCEQRKPVNCNFCNSEWTSVLKYEQHLQDKHAVAIKHKCETCGKTFSCSEYLAVHRKRHNERYYQCDLCPKNYINNAELKVHKQRIHDIKNVSVSCNLCKQKFANLKLLKYHENQMHKERFLQCDLCQFVSTSCASLKIHQYSHKGKPYQCQKCEKEFAFRYLLRQHLKRQHSTTLTHEEMAEYFKQTFGYTSRYDTFSELNNIPKRTEVNAAEDFTSTLS